jgi:2-oxoglutarate ferredoxin oxidoreductase subunit delta
LSSKRTLQTVLMPVRGRNPFNINKVLKPRGRPHINSNICKGCGFCIEFCPIGVLEFSDTVNPWGYQYPRIKPGMEDACVNCGMCERVCPEFAIEVFEEPPIPYKVSWVE